MNEKLPEDERFPMLQTDDPAADAVRDPVYKISVRFFDPKDGQRFLERFESRTDIAISLGGYNALAEAGLSIPDDISVMGYDGIYLSRVVNPSLVTYQQNTAALGQTAADKLIELIEHPRVTLPEQIRVSGRLLLGRSVRSL